MPLTREIWTTVDEQVAWLTAELPRIADGQYTVDVSDVCVVVVPTHCDKRILPIGNPALYLNDQTPRSTVTEWEDALATYARTHPDELIRAGVAADRTVLLSEPRPDAGAGDRLTAQIVLWHEFGHAVAVRRGMPNTEVNAYLFEIDVLTHAMRTRRLDDPVAVARYVEGRMPDYRYQSSLGTAPTQRAGRLGLRQALARLREIVLQRAPGTTFGDPSIFMPDPGGKIPQLTGAQRFGPPPPKPPTNGQ